MGYEIKICETPSIPDLFRDAARHSLSEMRDYSGVEDFKTARINISPMCLSPHNNGWSFPITFSFGKFDIHWMGEYVWKEMTYGRFACTGKYQDKLSFIHPDWIEMEEADLMFECCQEFMKVCQALRNGEIQPFEDDEETED